MSKGLWKNRVQCNCSICPRCIGRARRDKIRQGTWKPRPNKKKEQEELLAARKMKREEKKAEKEAEKDRREYWKVINQKERARRWEAIKRNIAKYGRKKAMKIACIITAKRNKTFIFHPLDAWEDWKYNVCRSFSGYSTAD